jgi:hypothetical protein
MEEEKKTVLTGVRLAPSQHKKLLRLAETLGVTKNNMFGILIDTATVTAPKINIGTAVLQPPVQAQVENDGDILWA